METLTTRMKTILYSHLTPENCSLIEFLGSMRLGAVLEHIKEAQEQSPPKKQRAGKQRTRYEPTGRRNLEGWNSKLAQRAKAKEQASLKP